MNGDQKVERVRNILLRIAYDGTDFYGWQIQPRRPTIQGTLTEAIAQVCGETVHLCGSGRTDAGVHACEQAANARLVCRIPSANLLRVLNDRLPESIRVLSAQEVAPDFHARHDARSKTYRYRIYRGAICPPWLSRYVFPCSYPLEEAAMQEAARNFEGTWDFRSLASADGSPEEREKSSVRTVFSSGLERLDEELVYTVTGNGFLHHMVRNLVGTLLLVGRRKLPPAAIRDILAARERSAAGPTVPARGLHLVRVSYSEELVPSVSSGPAEGSR